MFDDFEPARLNAEDVREATSNMEIWREDCQRYSPETHEYLTAESVYQYWLQRLNWLLGLD
jgi:hypothetical protein